MAKLPIPNIPLASLAQEFHQYDLRLFEPLLHDELKLPAPERCEFVEWPECRGAVSRALRASCALPLEGRRFAQPRNRHRHSLKLRVDLARDKLFPRALPFAQKPRDLSPCTSMAGNGREL